MRFSKYPGIRLKITLAFSLVFALLSIFLNLYSYSKIRQLIVADNNRYLLSRASALLDKTETSPVIIPLPDKHSALKVFSRHPDGTRALLFQSPGTIRKIAPRNKSGVMDTLGLRVAYVINSSDENPAELLLAVSGDPLQATLRYLLLLLLLSTLLSVLISGLIAFWLARFFLLPVQRIITKTKTINAGDLRERVPVRESNDELQELSETINGMLGRIELSLQQQRNFFASASHELKTPLAVMRAELEVNLKKPGLDPVNRALIASQLEEIGRLQQVVEEFLLISQIQSDKLTLNNQKFDLSDLCLKIVHQFRGLAAAYHTQIDLRFDRETDDFQIVADKEKIHLVLSNLLINALKYGVHGQPVSLGVARAAQHGLSISVRNGTAEPYLDTSRLTNAFYREHILDGGAGVGLWLCRELLHAHQAELSLISQNHAFSAEFTLRHQRML